MEILSTNGANYAFGRWDIILLIDQHAPAHGILVKGHANFTMTTVLTNITTKFFFLSCPGFIRPVVVRLVGDMCRSGLYRYARTPYNL